MNEDSLQFSITEAQARIRELEQQIERAREEERARIARELHDGLGQLVTGLTFQLFALKVRLDRVAPEETDSLEKLSQLASEVSREARDFAHQLAPVDVDPEGLFTSLEHLAQTSSNVFKVMCTFHYSGPRPVPLTSAASNDLHRIAQEAITNAHRHGKAARISITLRCDTHAALEIIDDGVGISPADTPSTGIGLRNMRQRASDHQGTFLIQRRSPAGGTLLRVTLPLSNLSNGRVSDFQKQGPGIAPQPFEKPEILLVDDHPVVRAGLRQLIEQTGELTVGGEARNAQEAFEFCSMKTPSLLVTDMLLGDTSALDYVRTMRQRYPQMPIAVLSMYPPERYRKPSLEAGADEYLSKQTAPAELLATIRRLASKDRAP